jgi:hypothetical protein
MEKAAFLSKALDSWDDADLAGGAGRAAHQAYRKVVPKKPPTPGIVSGIGRSLKSMGGSALSVAGKAPLQTALGVAMAPFAVKEIGAATSRPSRSQANMAMQRQARYLHPGRQFSQTRTASMQIIPPDDLKIDAAVRRGLEKSAARVPRTPKRGMRAARENLGDWSLTGRYEPKSAAPSTPTSKADSGKFSLFGGETSPSFKHYLLAGLALGTAGTAAGLGGQALASGAGKVGEMTHRLGRNRHYNQMTRADPGLKEYSPAEVRQAFNVVHKASPYVAKEPLLAASAVRSIVDAPRSDMGSKVPTVSLDAVKKIMDVESARQGTRYPMFQEVKDAKPSKIDKAGDLLG